MTNKRLDASLAILQEQLLNFPKYLSNGWTELGNDAGYFGDGSNQENGIRTNANVLYTAAVLASNAKEFGLAPAAELELRSRAKRVLNYLTRSHRVGGGFCANGRKWGLEWQSSWWSAKIALAARELWPQLNQSEQQQLRRLIVSEASRQIARTAPTGLFLDTKAEETAWDCEILSCAIAMLPEHPDLPNWEKKLREFSANVFSSPHDRVCADTLDGERVKDIVYTCNIHGDYSLENHGAFHFCYVASPLLSKAWCFYALRSAGRTVPEALYHNVREVWGLARKLFLTNRFAYVGGQDWARYTYGEYFIVPSLIFLADYLEKGSELEILEARLQTLAAESRGNDDGSFFGLRFTKGHYDGQHAKYETDCFCCLALAWSLCKSSVSKPHVANVETRIAAADAVHVSPEGQFWFARGDRYFASFCWSTLTAEVPNISYINLDDDSLAEWHAGNLVGLVKTLQMSKPVWVRSMRSDGAKLISTGTGLYRNRRGKALYEHILSVRFDLISKELRIHSQFVASSSLWLVEVIGLAWRVPNDLFNNSVRILHNETGSLELRQTERKPSHQVHSFWSRVARRLGFDRSEVRRLASRWINIDGKVGLVIRNHHQIFVRTFPEKTSDWKSLAVEQFETPRRRLRLRIPAGKIFLETDAVLHFGTAEQTSALARNEQVGAVATHPD